MVTAQVVTLKGSMKRENRMVGEGFEILLNPRVAEEYEEYHNKLWPEMKEMIRQYGGHNCSIFLDRETNMLYGYLEVGDEELWAKSADTSINRKWWNYMTNIMETYVDSSPVYADSVPVSRLN